MAIGVSITTAPPVLPVYVQPPCPTPGYIWTPGYWAWGPEGYYWVPGAWVAAPYVGALWTPGYWGWSGGLYIWNGGYWGPHVGYYGGVNYGFGYHGVGYVGGSWIGREFHYNTAVTNVNTTVIKNVYVNKTVINNTTIVNNSRVSYNGGPGGLRAQPLASERIAERDQHMAAVHEQVQHEQVARADRSFLASQNGGHPAVGAVERPMNAQNHVAMMNAARNNPAPQMNHGSEPVRGYQENGGRAAYNGMQSHPENVYTAHNNPGPRNNPAPPQHYNAPPQEHNYQPQPHQNEPHPQGGGHGGEEHGHK